MLEVLKSALILLIYISKLELFVSNKNGKHINKRDLGKSGLQSSRFFFFFFLKIGLLYRKSSERALRLRNAKASHASLQTFCLTVRAPWLSKNTDSTEKATLSSYMYSMWVRTDIRTLGVCLQQRLSKVTWNYKWKLTSKRCIVNRGGKLKRFATKADNRNVFVPTFQAGAER